MSSIASWRRVQSDPNNTAFTMQDPRCSFCATSLTDQGGAWSTYDNTTLFCCPECAQHILPRMMADCVALEHVDARKFWLSAENSFFKAISSRLARALRGAK